MIDRYALPRMKGIWADESRYRRWLEVEVLAAEAWAELGVIPGPAVEAIRERTQGVIDAAFVRRVEELEATVRHDVIAFVSAVAERVGEEGKYVHYGLTSYDVVDTALSAALVESAGVILEDLDCLAAQLLDLAWRHKDRVMIGRTHGVHAEPVTLGLKFALWYWEIVRHIDRVRRARETIGYGKLSGAVGTYAHIDPYVERYVCERMGLRPSPLSTQILQRDRHAEYVLALALIGSSLDKFAQEIRGLQRTEIRELEEPFATGQKGSSAMPHKRNPVLCEQLSGLARILRGNALAALENISLWHERDISNSSVERVILPDSSILADYMLQTFCRVLEGLHVYPDNMEHNIHLTGGLIYSQQVMLALVARGLPREEAYGIVQERAMEAWRNGRGGPDFRTLIEGDPAVRRFLAPEELASCFDYRPHLKHIDTIFDRLRQAGPPPVAWSL